MPNRLFYTGATSPEDDQLEGLQSLGGFISKSRIPDNTINNLFNGLSMYDLQNKDSNCRCVGVLLDPTTRPTQVLVELNETGTDNADSTPQFDVLIGLEQPEEYITDHKEQHIIFSRITSRTQRPGIDYQGIDMPLPIPAVAMGIEAILNQYVGLWIVMTPRPRNLLELANAEEDDKPSTQVNLELTFS